MDLKKSSYECQTTLLNWKKQFRHKALTIKTPINETAGGTQCDKQLSDLEDRALVCWERLALNGASIEDIGIITDKLDDNVLNMENAARLLSPTSPISTTFSIFVTATPHTQPMSREPTISKLH